MTSVNSGPSVSTTANTQAAYTSPILANVPPATLTFAQLSAQYPASGLVPGTTFVTSDLSVAFSTPNGWTVLPQFGVPNPAVFQLKKWRGALARVRAGAGRARLVLIGDSTTAGVGAGTSGTSNSVGARPKSRTVGLTARLNALGVAVSDNSFFGDQGMITLPTSYPLYDPRVTLGANWTGPAGGSTSTLAGQMFLYTSGSVNNFTFTPNGVVAGNGAAIDTAIVYTARSGSNGSFTWNVDGGASLGTITTNGGPALNSTTATFAKAAHTINFVPDNNNNIYLAGCLSYDSTVSAVDIIQAGWAGALIASFDINTSPWHPVGMFNLIAPDLTIIQITINNSNSSTPPATYAQTLQALVTRALAVGDCIIESGIPSSTASATNGKLAGIIAAARAVATANNVPFIDLNARWVDYVTSNALGWMFDTLHPNATGYQDVAQAEAPLLALI